MSLPAEEYLEQLKEMRGDNICGANAYIPSLKIL